MEDQDGYAVYFFPPALEALGEAIKPFLLQGPTGEHVLCRRIDTAGSLIGMHLYGRDGAGRIVQVELMVPANMVRMIVSAHSDEAFGFGPRAAFSPSNQAGAQPGDRAAPDAPAQDPPPAGTAAAASAPGRPRSPASKAPPAKARPAKPASKPAARKPESVSAATSKPRP